MSECGNININKSNMCLGQFDLVKKKQYTYLLKNDSSNVQLIIKKLNTPWFN